VREKLCTESLIKVDDELPLALEPAPQPRRQADALLDCALCVAVIHERAGERLDMIPQSSSARTLRGHKLQLPFKRHLFSFPA
jgi:hypothetical protein